jgi:predicted metal-dependent HD superfamily phosphohydrolase
MESPQHWPLPQAAALRDELAAAYADPSRHYHDLRHLTEVLTRLEVLAGAGVPYDRLPVQLAAWFHDAVYDGERDAEERSAAWAEHALPPYAEEPTIAEVARLVRLTETHEPEPEDANGTALSDADLGILAADEARYDEYVACVRAEYAHIGDAEFRIGRAQVLSTLLNRDRLFSTAHGHEHWEAPARANMQREYEALTR